MMQTLTTMYMKGQIKPVIDQTLPMKDLHKAYAIMGSRSVWTSPRPSMRSLTISPMVRASIAAVSISIPEKKSRLATPP